MTFGHYKPHVTHITVKQKFAFGMALGKSVKVHEKVIY